MTKLKCDIFGSFQTLCSTAQDEYQNHFGHASKQFAEGGDVPRNKNGDHTSYLSFPNWLSSQRDEAITRENECLWQDIFVVERLPPDFFFTGDYNLKLASFLICFVIQFGQVLSASWEFLYQFSHMKCEERIMQNPP